jgi:hypothetical protein
VRRVRLVAIAGVGMTALAGMLQQRGYRVTGSDETLYPPMSLVVERLGIPLFTGYRPENLAPPPDLVIVGNKVSRDNPEVQGLLASGIPYLSLPEALAQFFIAGHRSLVVAGTHGKTTSTAMLAWVLEQAGDPGLMVGGEPDGGNFKLGGRLFVVEGDEYDSLLRQGPKFLTTGRARLLTAVGSITPTSIAIDPTRSSPFSRAAGRHTAGGAGLSACSRVAAARTGAPAAAAAQMRNGDRRAARPGRPRVRVRTRRGRASRPGPGMNALNALEASARARPVARRDRASLATFGWRVARKWSATSAA